MVNKTPVKKELQPLLSIIVLSSNRLDLLWICLNSLFYHLDTYLHWELHVLNHSASQEEGLFHLLDGVKGEYIMTVEDDWYFFPMGGTRYGKDLWIQDAIKILDLYPDITVVKLRQDEDGQASDGTTKRLLTDGKRTIGQEIRCSNIGHNPFIMKTSVYKELMDAVKKDPVKENIRFKFKRAIEDYSKKIGYPRKVAKLFFKSKWNRRGVCVHTGYGRRLSKSGV